MPTTPYLALDLVQLGYSGVTGTTPNQLATDTQVTALQNSYASALNGQTIGEK